MGADNENQAATAGHAEKTLDPPPDLVDSTGDAKSEEKDSAEDGIAEAPATHAVATEATAPAPDEVVYTSSPDEALDTAAPRSKEEVSADEIAPMLPPESEVEAAATDNNPNSQSFIQGMFFGC